jgi:hypothetical protein
MLYTTTTSTATTLDQEAINQILSQYRSNNPGSSKSSCRIVIIDLTSSKCILWESNPWYRELLQHFQRFCYYLPYKLLKNYALSDACCWKSPIRERTNNSKIRLLLKRACVKSYFLLPHFFSQKLGLASPSIRSINQSIEKSLFSVSLKVLRKSAYLLPAITRLCPQ